MASRRKDRRTLRDLVPSDTVVQKLFCATPEEAFRELLNTLVIAGVMDLSREEATLLAILEREKVASTGIGNGIAIPHAKSRFAERFGVAVGLSAEGLDFHAHDGAAVKVVFLWVCPPAQTKDHLALMRGLASVAQDPDNVDRIAHCRDRKALLDLLGSFQLDERK